MTDHSPLPSCPDEETLACFSQGTLGEAVHARVESHAAACQACYLHLWGLMSSSGELGGTAGIPRLRRFSPRGWAGAAAAALLCVVVGARWRVNENRPAQESEAPIPIGRRIEAQGAFRTGPGQEEILALPDGSRLRAGEHTDFRFMPLVSGERVHIRLERGSLEALVSKGDGLFRIASRAGEARVLGTHLRAEAFELAGGDVFGARWGGPVLCVEVREGKVALRNGRGEVLLDAGRRGISLSGEAPIAQERTRARAEAAGRFMQTVEWTGAGWKMRPGQEYWSRLLAATVWGFRWDGDAVESSGLPPLLKEVRFPPEGYREE